MRNKPLKGLMRKSGAPSNPSVSDSSHRGMQNINTNIKIIPKKSQKQKDFEDMQRAAHVDVSKGRDKLIDTTKRNRDRVMQGNALARLFTGIKPKGS